MTMMHEHTNKDSTMHNHLIYYKDLSHLFYFFTKTWTKYEFLYFTKKFIFNLCFIKKFYFFWTIFTIFYIFLHNFIKKI